MTFIIIFSIAIGVVIGSLSNHQRRFEINVVIYPEDGIWIAQGLQFDITARGSTPNEAVKRFDAKVGAELVMSLDLGDNHPLAGVAPAPKKFWQMFESAELRVLVPALQGRQRNSS